jgi:hypothetical protein
MERLFATLALHSVPVSICSLQCPHVGERAIYVTTATVPSKLAVVYIIGSMAVAALVSDILH